MEMYVGGDWRGGGNVEVLGLLCVYVGGGGDVRRGSVEVGWMLSRVLWRCGGCYRGKKIFHQDPWFLRSMTECDSNIKMNEI